MATLFVVQGATSAPGAMPAVTSPKQRVGPRVVRSPQLSGGPALAVEVGADARNASVRCPTSYLRTTAC
jgi:hypothetical protein